MHSLSEKSALVPLRALARRKLQLEIDRPLRRSDLAYVVLHDRHAAVSLLAQTLEDLHRCNVLLDFRHALIQGPQFGSHPVMRTRTRKTHDTAEDLAPVDPEFTIED